MSSDATDRRSIKRGWLWVPSLYFAEGIPYVVVMTVAVVLYKNMGIDNDSIAFYTSWLYLPWVVKALWSPFVDLVGSKRHWIIAMQAGIAVAFAAIGAVIGMKADFFKVSIAAFWLLAFLSATHDIAADGFYMYGLTERGQSWWVGLRTTFYRLAMLAGQGGVVTCAGMLAAIYGIAGGWMRTFVGLSILFVVLSLWHSYVLPRPEADSNRRVATSDVWRDFCATFFDFFTKRHVGVALLFILFYRFAEAQLVKMIPPFLLDLPEMGGIGLTTVRVGITYGTIGLGALMAGGIAGGFIAARYGLRRCIMPMAWSMSLTCATFVLLAFVPTPATWLVDVCVGVEQAGYGFGTTAFTLYLLHFSAGKRRTSYYAIATGLMALGMMLPGMWAGWLQERLGYARFFIWTMACCITTIIAAWLAKRTLNPTDENTDH